MHEDEHTLRDYVLSQQRQCPFEPAATELIDGHNKTAVILGQELQELFEKRRETHANSVTLVHPDTTLEVVHKACVDGPDARRAVIEAAGNGWTHHALRLGKPKAVEHPGLKLLDGTAETETYVVYSHEVLQAGTFLGLVSGTYTTGKEAENHAANDVLNLTASVKLTEMEGSLESFGGWVDDKQARQRVDLDILCLDGSRSPNILQYFADYREDPLANPTQLQMNSQRKVNVVLAEVMCEGIPRLAVVTATRIDVYDEVIIDYREEHWLACQPIYERARNIHGTQTMLNETLDKKQTLEALFNPMVVESRQYKKQVALARTAAVMLQINHKVKTEGYNVVPCHQPGSLDADVIRESFGFEDAGFAEKLSTLQDLVFNELFQPQRAAEQNGIAVMVENTTDEKYMELKRNFRNAPKVVNEVVRAWTEMQNYQHLCTNTRHIPWDFKTKEPLELSDIILLLAAQMFGSSNKQLNHGNSKDDESDDKDDFQDERDVEEYGSESDIGKQTRPLFGSIFGSM